MCSLIKVVNGGLPSSLTDGLEARSDNDRLIAAASVAATVIAP